MVVCIIGLVVFAVLGIFSAKYRALAKEAFSCTFRKLTFKPCDTGLDVKIKAATTSKLIRWPRIAKFVHKNFERITALLVIAMLATFVWSGAVAAKGLYNYAKFGNCNGPNSDNLCIFDIAGVEQHKIGTIQCTANDCVCITPSVNCTVRGDYTPCMGSTCTCSR